MNPNRRGEGGGCCLATLNQRGEGCHKFPSGGVRRPVSGNQSCINASWGLFTGATVPASNRPRLRSPGFSGHSFLSGGGVRIRAP